MSEVIENYIRRHPGLSEKEAFEGFLKEDRIRAWVGADESRKERLRSEFGRTWGSMHETLAPGSARSGPSGPTLQQPRTVRVDATPRAETQTAAPPAAEERPLAPLGTPGAKAMQHPSMASAAVGGGRRLQVLCTSCKRIEVFMEEDHTISCRHCGVVYHDMLQLIRVKPVGPLAFYFGEGWKGAAVAGGLVLGLAALYLLLRWL